MSALRSLLAFMAVVAFFVMPSFVSAQDSLFSAFAKCVTEKGEVAWQVQNNTDTELPISWLQGSETGSIFVPANYHTIFLVHPSGEPMIIGGQQQDRTSAHVENLCRYHVNFDLESSVPLAPDTFVLLTVSHLSQDGSVLDSQVVRCTLAACWPQSDANDDFATLEIPFGGSYSVKAEIYGSQSYAITGGVGTFIYPATQIPYDKTPLHAVVLAGEFEGTVQQTLGQCPDIVLATSSDPQGNAQVVTIRDTLVREDGTKQGNVVLHVGEQPTLRSDGLMYAAVETGDIYFAPTLVGSFKTYITTDSSDVVDSDPAYGRGGQIAFKRGDELVFYEDGEIYPVLDQNHPVHVGRANLAWSFNGQYLAYSGQIGELYVYNVGTGENRYVGQFDGLSELDWGPEYLAVATSNGTQRTIQLVKPLSQPLEVSLTLPLPAENPAFNAAGLLAFVVPEVVNEQSQLYVFDPATGISTPVVTSTSTIAAQPAWWCESVLVFQADIAVSGVEGRHDMEIHSIAYPALGPVMYESGNTFALDRVQYGPTRSSNENPFAESGWKAWFDTERMNLGRGS